MDLYKVGHHGSLNATPKTRWNLFEKKSERPQRPRLTSVVSTRATKHGSDDRGTEVPRRPLVRALKRKTDYHSNQEQRTGRPIMLKFPLKVPGHA